MKQVYLAGLMIIVLVSSANATVYEDAEDGRTDGWIASSGANVSNVYDDSKASRVIQLESNTYKYYRINTPNSHGAKSIKWDIKLDYPFYIYIQVTTTKGNRQLYYNAINRDYGVTSSGIHHGLGTNAIDNNWHTFERNIEADIQEADSGNQLISINSFKIRAIDKAYVDNIILTGGGNVGVAPTASAGADQTVTVGDAVSLDGSASSDSDGSIVSYVWKENGTTLSTNSSFTKNDFTVGRHTITLTVTDNDGLTASDTVDVTVDTVSGVAPTANAGADKSVTEGDAVTLNANGSNDSDGNIVSYVWKENGTTLSTNSSFTKSDFAVGRHTITLLVTDDDGMTDSDTVMVTVNAASGTAPIANAGTDKVTTVGSSVTLDASASRDSDGSIVSYVWKENGTILSTNSSFTKSDFAVGRHTITLLVTDDDGMTDSDTVVVTVNDSSSPISIVIPPAPDTHGAESVYSLPNILANNNPTFASPLEGTYGRASYHIYHPDISHDSGSGSVELKGHAWSKGLRTYNFYAEAHKKYLLSGYMKVKDFSFGQNVYFFVTGCEKSGMYWNVSKEDQWEEILVQFVPKTTGNHKLYMFTYNRSYSTDYDSNGIFPNGVHSDASNLDTRPKVFLDDLKIVQTNKIIPREPRKLKKPFNGSYIHVDGLGNFSVKDGSGWKSIFPKMIYRNSGTGNREFRQYAAYANYGFNGIMDIRRKSQVEYALNVGLKYFGVVYRCDSSLATGSTFYNETTNLIDYINNDIGKPYSVLFHNFDNEDSALQNYTCRNNFAHFVNNTDKDLVDPTKRARPIYYLNGHPGIARVSNNDNRVEMDITGSYVADQVRPKVAIPRPHATLEILDKAHNQVAPVTMIQLQTYLGDKLIPSLFYGIIQGGKGVSVWRDGGDFAKFQTMPWAPKIKEVFNKVDQMLPIIREAYWTTWSADIANKTQTTINIGTRNHNGNGYLILSSHSDVDETITVNLTGITASSVEDYFTHAHVANVSNGSFTTTIGHGNNGFLVLKINP